MPRSMKPNEQAIQLALVQHIMLRLAACCCWMSIPNGGWRTAIEAKILKGTGTRAGAPDLIFLREGCFYGLELKSKVGRTSPAQRAMHAEIRAAGGVVAVAHGLDEAIRILEKWQILRGKTEGV